MSGDTGWVSVRCGVCDASPWRLTERCSTEPRCPLRPVSGDTEATTALAAILNVAASLARRNLCVDDACWTDRQDSMCVEYAQRLKIAHDQLRKSVRRAAVVETPQAEEPT